MMPEMARLLDPVGGESPVAAGPVRVAAVLVWGSKARIDHAALHGRETPPVSRGRYFAVWIALKEDAFHGIAACEIPVRGGAPERDVRRQANLLASAARGSADASALGSEERTALRAFLHSCEPVLWDRAATEFKAALKG